jgi:putative transposase
MTSRLYQEQKPSSAHVPNGSQVLVLLRQAALSQASELARMGRYEDAELALDFNPESATPPVLDLIARIRAQQGRFAEAEKFWSEAVRQDTNNESYRAALQRLGRMNRHLWFGAMSQWFLGIVLIAPLIAVTDFGLHMWWQQQRRLLATEIKASSQPTHAKVISVPEIKFNLRGVTETTEEETSVLRFDQGLFKDSDVLTPQARVVLTAVAEQLPGLFCTSLNDRNWTKGAAMARGKKHTPEQVVNLLRQIEVALRTGRRRRLACKEAEITEQTYYRWRKEYGGLQVDQARRLKELEQENAKLKRLVVS